MPAPAERLKATTTAEHVSGTGAEREREQKMERSGPENRISGSGLEKIRWSGSGAGAEREREVA